MSQNNAFETGKSPVAMNFWEWAGWFPRDAYCTVLIATVHTNNRLWFICGTHVLAQSAPEFCRSRGRFPPKPHCHRGEVAEICKKRVSSVRDFYFFWWNESIASYPKAATWEIITSTSCSCGGLPVLCSAVRLWVIASVTSAQGVSLGSSRVGVLGIVAVHHQGIAQSSSLGHGDDLSWWIWWDSGRRPPSEGPNMSPEKLA